MGSIFTFIFNSISNLFKLLDFNLPGIELSYLDFFLLVMIIPLIFKLVRGAVSESGTDLVFNGLGSFSDSISSSRKISYSNYKNKRSRNESYSEKYKSERGDS